METSSTIINGTEGASSAPICTVGPVLVDSETTTPFLAEKVEISSRSAALDRAAGLIRGLCVVLAHHNCPSPVLEDFKRQATVYLDCEEPVFFKRAKYLTVAPMAAYLKCEPPKAPDTDWHPAGQYKAWAQKRLKTFTRRNTHLWYSFLQGKRSAFPLSEALVLTTYEEHRKAMSVADPIDRVTLDTVMKELEPVLQKIQQELLRSYDTEAAHREYVVDAREVQHSASVNACYEVPRSRGGQMGHLRTLVPGLNLCDPNRPLKAGRRLPELRSIQYYPIAMVGGVVEYNALVEVYSYDGLEIQPDGTVTPYGERAWHMAIRRQVLDFAGKRLTCTIQAVLEPLKVRVISKGNAMPYYVSKVLQDNLRTIMARMGCFRLIGRPLCPTDLIDLADQPVLGGSGPAEWFSIDYSAATDKLSASLSSAILTRLLVGQEPVIQSLWRSVLAPHRCEYPEGFDVAPVDQVNGQLMGSVLSFPILCLANLGLYLANISDDPRKLRQKLRGVLVNGDDMLYVARASRWQTHVRLGEKVGLTMSPGKAYHHQVYANANSACFHCDLTKSNVTPFSIPFLNVGLYFGQNKVMAGSEEEVDRKSVSSTLNRLLQGSLPGKQCDVLRCYISRHSKRIAQECGDRNLFISPSLGGMGVDLPRGFDAGITIQQQQEAYRRFNADRHLWLDSPMPGGPVREAVQQLQAPWIAKPEVEVQPRLKRWTRAEVPKLKKDHCLLGARICSLPRPDFEGSYHRLRCSDRFVRDYRRDLWELSLDTIQDELVAVEAFESKLGLDFSAAPLQF